MEEECWLELQALRDLLPATEATLLDELHSSALDYAVARGRWQLADVAGRAEIDPPRTRAHNRFIDACNALSRACGRSGLSQEWRAAWGDARTGEARRRIGDFACFIVYRIMLQAR